MDLEIQDEKEIKFISGNRNNVNWNHETPKIAGKTN
jgi:hypothetical protein